MSPSENLRMHIAPRITVGHMPHSYISVRSCPVILGAASICFELIRSRPVSKLDDEIDISRRLGVGPPRKGVARRRRLHWAQDVPDLK